MKLVLVAFALVLSAVSSSALASGCDPRDGGSEVLGTVDFIASGEVVCVADQYCEFRLNGSQKLIGTDISAVSGTKNVKSAPGKITREHVWGSCITNGESVTMSVQIDGQTYSSELSFYSAY